MEAVMDAVSLWEAPKSSPWFLKTIKTNCPAERSQSKEDAPKTIIQGAEWPSKTESRKKKKNPEDEANDGTDVSAFVGKTWRLAGWR